MDKDKEKKEIIFVEGIKVRKIDENFYAMSIKLDKFNEWAKEHTTNGGYVNMNICKSSQSTLHYVKWNDWKMNEEAPAESEEKIPF